MNNSVKPPKWCLKIINTFIINSKTGVITCTKDFNIKKRSGSELGKSDGNGYLKLIFKKEGFKDKHVRMHNIAWYLYYKEWPDHLVDHKDGNGENNKKSNLRKCNQNQNCRNREISINQSGFRGIRIKKHILKDGTPINYYQPRIFFNNRRISLGFFKNLDDAVDARVKAEKKYFKEFARANR